MAADLTVISEAYRFVIDAYKNNEAISIVDRTTLEAKYGKGIIEKWQKYYDEDKTRYTFNVEDFSDWESWQDQGEDKVKDKTGGYENDTGRKWTRWSGQVLQLGTSAAGGLIAGLVKGGAVNLSSKALGKLGEKSIGKVGQFLLGGSKKVTELGLKTGEKLGEEGAKKLSENVAKHSTKNLSWLIGIPVLLAMAILSKAMPANKKEHDAADESAKYIEEQTNELNAEQGVMAALEEEIQARADEAAQANEEANQQMLANGTTYDFYADIIAKLEAKAESEGGLAPDEIDLYNSLIGDMNDKTEENESVQSDTKSEVQGIYGEIGGLQTNFESSAVKMGEMKGATDYQASFDTLTEVMCWVDVGLHTANVVEEAILGVRAGIFAASGLWVTAWAWAFVAMATAAAALDIWAGVEQGKFALDLHKDIEKRHAGEDMNLETQKVFTQKVQESDDDLGVVEALELVVPEQSAVEGVEISVVDPSESESKLGDFGGSGSTTPKTNRSTGYATFNDILEGRVSETGEAVYDPSGAVVVSKQYGSAMSKVLGREGSGPAFDKSNIDAIIAEIMRRQGIQITAKDVTNIKSGGSAPASVLSMAVINTTTGENKGTTTVDNTAQKTAQIRKIINFYNGIISPCSAKGWIS